MATWVTHFRITEQFIKSNLPVSKIDFLVGNIGPDCGIIGEDGKPTPPKEITHFKVNCKISSDSFYNQYLTRISNFSSPEASYLLGYYFHLVTDEEWIKLTNQKKKEIVFQSILNTPDYTRLVKRDWYGQDFLYLKNNKESIFWTDFQYINEYSEYLSIFPTGQTSKQIKNITRFYYEHTIPEDHNFIYITSEEMDDFITAAVQTLKEILAQKMNIPEVIN